MDKKKIILTVITVLLLILVLFLAYLLFQKYVLKTNFENSILPFANNNQEEVYKINKITFFSNCDAKNKNIASSNFTIENLYQYTDIALFLNSTNTDITLENALKKVSISNIKFTKTPTLGTPRVIF